MLHILPSLLQAKTQNAPELHKGDLFVFFSPSQLGSSGEESKARF